MNRQSPVRKPLTMRHIPIGVLSLVLLLSMMACVSNPFGAKQTEETPIAIETDEDNNDDQVSTSVAQTVAALDQTRAPASEDTQPAPAATTTRISESTGDETTVPVAVGNSACGAGTADVCDVAAVVDVTALAVRDAPDTNAPLLDEVARDKRVDVLCLDQVQTDGRTWACVRTLKGGDSVEGWMSTRYLAFGMPEAPARDACDWATVVDVDALNMRQEPSTASNTMGEPLSQGTRVEVLCDSMVDADGRIWAPVRAGTVEGWMSTRYLEFDSAPTGAADATEPPPIQNNSECGAGILDVCDIAAVIEVSALAVRGNPDTSATLLDEVAKNKRVDVLCLDQVQSEDGRLWVCVRTLKGSNSVEGWMSKRYLEFGVPEAPARDACDWATVVQVEALNMRREPSRQSPTQGEPIPQGGRVEVLCDDMVEADGRTWAPVRAGTVEGWMSTTFLILDSAPEDVPAAPPPNSNPCGNTQVGMCDAATVVEVTALSVRDSPTRQGTLLGDVPKGRMVDVLCLDPVQSDGREWVCVSTGSGGANSVVGWMSTNYLQFQSEAPAPAEPAPAAPAEPATDVCDWAEVIEVEALTIRGTPTLQGPPMGAAPRGESVAVLCTDAVEADGRTWVKVRYKSGDTSFIVGWMSTNYLEFEFGTP